MTHLPPRLPPEPARVPGLVTLALILVAILAITTFAHAVWWLT